MKAKEFMLLEQGDVISDREQNLRIVLNYDDYKEQLLVLCNENSRFYPPEMQYIKIKCAGDYRIMSDKKSQDSARNLLLAYKDASYALHSMCLRAGED